MGINNIINNIKNTSWTWTDDFSFFFYNKSVQFPSMNLRDADIWDISVLNIDLPQVGATVESVVIGQEYRFWTQLHDTFTFTVTFRDVERMKLKEYFTKIWAEQQNKYFDDIKSTIKISGGNGVLFESSDCLITNVSQSQLDNSNTQIIEFSVEFITKSLSNNTLQKFSGWNER